MSTLHDKMQNDYLWVRGHNPTDINARQRTHGYSYLYNRAPNKFERLEMIYRSMGKQFDFEMEKFRLQKKSIDRGTKKRFVKNVLRFIKHPVGYFYWKTVKLRNHSPRMIVWGITFAVIGAIFTYRRHSEAVQRSNNLLLRLGKNVEGTPGKYLGYHHRKPYRQLTGFQQLMYYDLRAEAITISQTWRQNLRKELQLLNAYNIDL